MKATNNYVWVIRDKAEKTDLIIPSAGRVKQYTGSIVTVGSGVKDGNIKGGKSQKAIWHQTVGFEIDFEGETYTILEDHQIIGIA